MRDIGDVTRFCEAAGLDVEHCSDDFGFVHVNDQSVFDLDWASGWTPATKHAGCYIITDDADHWYVRFEEAGPRITPIEDVAWAMR